MNGDYTVKTSDCFEGIKNLTTALETAIRIRKAVVGAGEQIKADRIAAALLNTLEIQIMSVSENKKEG